MKLLAYKNDRQRALRFAFPKAPDPVRLATGKRIRGRKKPDIGYAIRDFGREKPLLPRRERRSGVQLAQPATDRRIGHGVPWTDADLDTVDWSNFMNKTCHVIGNRTPLRAKRKVTRAFMAILDAVAITGSAALDDRAPRRFDAVIALAQGVS